MCGFPKHSPHLEGAANGRESNKIPQRKKIALCSGRRLVQGLKGYEPLVSGLLNR